jgi:serine protease
MRIARVFNDLDEPQSSSEINKGIEWCADNGARVINMSLGAAGADTAMGQIIVNLVQNKNILVVAAAGNDGDAVLNFPASFPDAVSVAAVDQKLAHATFSNFNAQVDISGPGVDVLSTVPGNGYESFQGTSMACPHVAGAAAKIWAARPQCTNKQVREALEKTAKDLGAPGRDDLFGHGLVQVKSAFQVRENYGCNVMLWCHSKHLIAAPPIWADIALVELAGALWNWRACSGPCASPCSSHPAANDGNDGGNGYDDGDDDG